MGIIAQANEAVDNNFQLELFADDLILNHDPLVEHFKSREDAFKRGNPFYTDIDYEEDSKLSVSVKETFDNRVFLVKTRVALKPGKDGEPQLEEFIITEFDKQNLTDYALVEKAKELWAKHN